MAMRDFLRWGGRTFGKLTTEALPTAALSASIVNWLDNRRKGSIGSSANSRGQLYADITKIETEEGKKLHNLRMRIAKTAEGSRGNRTVMLLTKIPAEYGVRKEVLLSLDSAGDQEFQQALNFLNQDTILEFLTLIYRHAGPVFQTAYSQARGSVDLREFADDVMRHRGQAQKWMREYRDTASAGYLSTQERRQTQPWHRRHRTSLWVTGIITLLISLALLFG